MSIKAKIMTFCLESGKQKYLYNVKIKDQKAFKLYNNDPNYIITLDKQINNG